MANNFDAFIPELWAAGIIRNLDKVNLAMAVMANTAYEGEIAEFGDTVHVTTVGTPTVRAYTPGVPIVYEDLTPVDETLKIDQRYYEAFKVDDVHKAQARPNIRAVYEARMGVAMANHFDAAILGRYGEAHPDNVIDNTGAAVNITGATAGASHVFNMLVEAGRRLDEQNVPQDGRWTIVTPYFKSIMLTDTAFTNGSALGDSMLSTAMVGAGDARRALSAREAGLRGFIGQIAGFDVYVSNGLPHDGAGGYYCPFGQGQPVSFAGQIPPGNPEVGRMENEIADSVRLLALYGLKVFDEESKRLGYFYVDNS